MLCLFGLVLAEGIAGLWWAVSVAVTVGAFLAVTDRLGRPEWPVGLLALAGVGTAALYAMAFTATVPDPAQLAPVALGVGVGIVASQLYLHVAGSAVEQPA